MLIPVATITLLVRDNEPKCQKYHLRLNATALTFKVYDNILTFDDEVSLGNV